MMTFFQSYWQNSRPYPWASRQSYTCCCRGAEYTDTESSTEKCCGRNRWKALSLGGKNGWEMLHAQKEAPQTATAAPPPPQHSTFLASASYDGTVRIWDSKSGETRRVLTGHTGWVESVFSLPDGLIASTSFDKTIRIWDSKSGEAMTVLTGHTDRVCGVCSLPDGLIASASHDQTVRIWDSKSGEMTRVLSGHTHWVTSICSLPDGLIASASTDKTIRIWDSKSGETTRVLTGHTELVSSVCSFLRPITRSEVT